MGIFSFKSNFVQNDELGLNFDFKNVSYAQKVLRCLLCCGIISVREARKSLELNHRRITPNENWKP